MSEIASNIRRVKQAIRRAAEKAGRNQDDIKLIAISKTVETIKVKEAIDAGLTIFGENRIQEAQKKSRAACIRSMASGWASAIKQG